MRFSQREGYVIPRTVLQIEMMDAPLRNGIWSVLHEYFFSHGVHNHATRSSAYYALWQALWRDFFKRAVDELPPWFGNAQTTLREWFFQADWYEVYDLVEFVSRADVTQGMRPRFTVAINEILKREMAGYALIGDHSVRQARTRVNCSPRISA